jgi:hypothetical protein
MPNHFLFFLFIIIIFFYVTNFRDGNFNSTTCLVIKMELFFIITKIVIILMECWIHWNFVSVIVCLTT